MSIIKLAFGANETNDVSPRGFSRIATAVIVLGVLILLPETRLFAVGIVVIAVAYEAMYWCGRALWAATKAIAFLVLFLITFPPMLAWAYRRETWHGIKCSAEWFGSLFKRSETTTRMRQARKQYRDEVRNIKGLGLPADHQKIALEKAYLRFTRRVDQIMA